MTRSWLRIFAPLVLLLASCTGTPLQIPTQPLQAGETELGAAEGTSTGLMLFQFIPIKQNERFNAAYSEALAQYPGATRLVDMEIQENWFWAYILNGYSFKVSGTAVK